MDAGPLIAAQGNPDWQGMLATAGCDLLPAYRDAHLHFAVPKAARLALRQDGTPAFFLEFFSDRNDPDPNNSLYAMLEMGLERELDLAQAYAELCRARPGATLLPLTFTGGTWCHLELGATGVSLPFAWDGAGRATLNARLPLAAARLMYGALAAGATTIVRSAIECEVAALLPRHEAGVGFDAHTLLPALAAALDPAGQGIPFDALVRWLDQPPSGLLEVYGAAGPPFGLALAGRLRQAFGRFAPCVRVADGPRIRFDPAPAAEAAVVGRTRWDLRTPWLCAVPVFLRCDPFGFLAGRGMRDKLSAFTSVPRLPDELRTRQVTVTSSLPDTICNCSGIDVNLRVDKDDALSGMTATQAVVLYPPQARSTTVDLAYAKTGTSKPYRARVTVAGDMGVIVGPWFDGGDYLFIEAASLPLQVLSVQATDALLAQAVLSLTLDGGSGGSGARLDRTRPGAAFLLDAPAPGARLRIAARSVADPDQLIGLDLPCRSVELDTASFRQYGPQTVAVSVAFHEGTNALRLEFQAESADAAPVVLGFSTAAPQGSFSYFATNIFKNRWRFRAYEDSNSDDAGAPWSAFFAPEQGLAVGMYRDGPRRENRSIPPGEPSR